LLEDPLVGLLNEFIATLLLEDGLLLNIGDGGRLSVLRLEEHRLLLLDIHVLGFNIFNGLLLLRLGLSLLDHFRLSLALFG